MHTTQEVIEVVQNFVICASVGGMNCGYTITYNNHSGTPKSIVSASIILESLDARGYPHSQLVVISSGHEMSPLMATDRSEAGPLS